MSALQAFKSDFGKCSGQASGLISRHNYYGSISCDIQPTAIQCLSGSTRVSINTSTIPDASMGLWDSNSCPFEEVDLITIFFIPTRAIQCTVNTHNPIECEGLLDCAKNTIHIFAVDVDDFGWFQLEIKLLDADEKK